MSGVPNSDLPQEQAGLDGAATPSSAGAGNGVVPTGGSDASLTTPDGTSPEQASEGGAPLELHEDDLAFLQSEEVRQYLAQNPPPGFVPESEIEKRISGIQSVKDREIAEARKQAQQVQQQQAELQASLGAMRQALHHSWRQEGLEPNTPEWQQRDQQIQSYIKQTVDLSHAERIRGQEKLNNYADEQESQLMQQFSLLDLDPEQTPQIKQLVDAHRKMIVEQQYESLEAVNNAARHIVNFARRFKQGQQQSPAPTPQQQPTPHQNNSAPQQQRPNPGPSARAVRRGGGPTNLSMDDQYQQAYQNLLAQYDNNPYKIPAEETERIWLEAYANTVGG